MAAWASGAWATNAWAANSWEGMGSAAETIVSRINWKPVKYTKQKLKKKDESILEEIHAIIAKAEEIPGKAPKLKERIIKTKERVDKVIMEQAPRKDFRLVELQIARLSKTIDIQVRKARKDEEAAINALLVLL